MRDSRAELLVRLSERCVNCGCSFGFHGAAKPHTCPVGETNYQAAQPKAVPSTRGGNG